jgi:hypothetical protein
VGRISKPQTAARRKPSALIALAISVALHAGFWLLARRVRPPAPPRPDSLQIEIVETPPPSAAVPESQPAPPPGPSPKRPASTKLAERPRPIAAPAAPAPESPAGTAPRDELSLSMRPAAPSMPGGLPLPSAATLGRAGIDLGPPPATAGPAVKRESAWSRAMNQRAREEAARGVVASGHAPPEAFDLLREIERRYQPSQKLVIDLTRAEAGRSRDASRWLGRYLGGFLDFDPTEKDKPFERDAAFRRALGNARLDYSARVCLSFGADGTPHAEIEGGSKIAELERLARDLVLQAADRRPGLGGAARACYRFSARLERVPPLPVFFCGLNGDLRPECIYPLKEIASTKVELDGVELAAQAAPAPAAGP